MKRKIFWSDCLMPMNLTAVKIENMSLIEKVKSLESELLVAREQLDRTSTSKLDNMLNVQKSTSDKTGLRFF